MNQPSINFHTQTRLAQFRIPTELARKNFKTVQKLIEKQKKHITDEISKIKKLSLSAKEKLELIDREIAVFENFQKKLKASVAQDEEYRLRFEARLENLHVLDDCVLPQPTEEQDPNDRYLDLHSSALINWYRDQTNLLVVDYLIKSNASPTKNMGLLLLQNLAELNPKLKKLIDYDLYENFNKVYMSIVADHDLSLVKYWLTENKSFLKKSNSNLEFEINYSQFLSYVEKGNIGEAIYFSQSVLSPYCNVDNYLDSDLTNCDNNRRRMNESGGLFLLSAIEGEEESFSSSQIKTMDRFKSYEKLLSDERWHNLAQVFCDNFASLYGLSKNYPFFIYLSAGLASLKTKSCYKDVDNTIFNLAKKSSTTPISNNVLTDRKYRGPDQYHKLLHNINNCPICSPEMYELSSNLPYAQLLTNVFNNPFKLPNGNIYPFDKLLEPLEKYLSEKNTLLRMGKVKDPLTREVFHIDNCVRVYPA